MEALGIRSEDIQERFILGSGKGGQKQNKTSNCVLVHHIPTGIQVRCQRERERNKNRFIALRLLVDAIERQQGGGSSHEEKKIAKIRKQKKRQIRRRLSDTT